MKQHLSKLKWTACLKIATLAGLLLSSPGFVNAQDTYWALTGDRRLNTYTGKVINNRSGDIDILLSNPGSNTFYYQSTARGIFDNTGRCIFTIGGSLNYGSVYTDDADRSTGGYRAFPVTIDKCKQYGVVGAFKSGNFNKGFDVNFQLVDASDVDGTVNSNGVPMGTIPWPVPSIAYSGFVASDFKWGVDVTKGPNGTHYVYVMANVVDGSGIDQVAIYRYTVNIDGTFSTTPVIYSSFNQWPLYAGMFKVDEGSHTLVYRSEATGSAYHITRLDLTTQSITSNYSNADPLYGLTHTVVGGEDRWYYMTAGETGYLTVSGHTTLATTGSKSNLAIGGNGRIYYATGNPGAVAGTLYSFDPSGYSPTAVLGGANVVYSNGQVYSFGNMVEGENTSTAVNYDEMDNYAFQAGSVLWTPSSNPAVDYNGGGTYGTYRFRKNLSVNPGTVATVKGMKIEMAQDARIFIKNGDEKNWSGYLKLDQATITGFTDCKGTALWSGVQVWGDNTKTQAYIGGGSSTNSYQATLKMINDATLSNARFAAQTWREGDNTYTSGGGMIYTTDAHFINNRKSIGFFPYTNPYNIYSPYHSSFYTTEFAANSAMTEEFIGFMSGWGLLGLSIIDCRFVNDAFNSYANNSGISGFDFGIHVGSVTGGPGCYFKNLHHAIDISSVNGLLGQVNVQKATFDANVVGIVTNSVEMPVIRLNTFYVSPIDKGEARVGLNINTGSGYVVSKNYFKGGSVNIGSIGAVITSTGSDNNYVNFNTYENLAIGNASTEQNKSITSTDGLQFTCNTYKANSFDEYIDGFDQGFGIASKQGNRELAAGNVFSNNPTSTAIFNNADPIEYYYFNTPGLEQYPQTSSGLISTFNARENSCIYPEGDVPLEPLKAVSTENVPDETETPDIIDYDSKLSNRNSAFGSLTKVDKMIEQGKISEANKTFDAIPETYKLTGSEAEEFRIYGRELTALRVELKQANTHLKNLSADQIARLENIAAHGKMWAKVRAQNWLTLFDGRVYNRTILVPPAIGGNTTPIESNTDAFEKGKKIWVYPTPADDHLTITYHNSTDNGSVIVLTDLTGKQMQKQVLSGKAGTLTLDVKALTPGMYLYRVMEGTILLAQGKVVKE